MPQVFRRTPETEEAASYGYTDLLKDMLRQTSEGRAAQSDRLLRGELTDEDMIDFLFAGVGAGTKIARGLGKGKFPFSLKASDIKGWTEVFKRPAAAKKRGASARIEFMSPREYFEKIQKGEGKRWPVEDYIDDTESFRILQYARDMEKGAKFPLPGMEFQGKIYAGQEGRHRVLAARKLGIDRIPVLVVKSAGRKTAQEKLMERFSKEGLRYDAFTEPIPGSPQFNYHQWTLYGEGPAKGATFGTKGTGLEEMEGKIADLMRKFSKEPTPIRRSVPDPITGEPMTKFRVRPGGRQKWSAETPTQTKVDREVVKERIQPGKWKAGVEKNEITGYIVEGYNPKTGKWLWFNTEDTWLAAEQAVKRSEEFLKKGGR